MRYTLIVEENGRTAMRPVYAPSDEAAAAEFKALRRRHGREARLQIRGPDGFQRTGFGLMGMLPAGPGR